jgi:hypothetical protein
MKIKIDALNIAKVLPNGPNMRDLMWTTSLVMTAGREEFAETEKEKNRVRSEMMIEQYSTGSHMTVQGIKYYQNIKVIVEKTSEAVKSFNRLCGQGKDVAGAFHLTC